MNIFETLLQKKKDLLTREKPSGSREAAKELEISEAEYLALSFGETCTMLDNKRFSELLLQFEPVGEVMALTRNDAIVLEHRGVYQGGVINKGSLTFKTSELHLLLKVSKWKYGFAIDQNSHQSLQFFDKFGEISHKIIITDASNKTAYEKILSEFSIAGHFNDLTIKSKPETVIQEKIDVDQQAIHKDWRALNDVHQVNALLKTYGLTRPQAYSYLEEDALALQSTALGDLLKKMSKQQLPLLIFVSNPTSIQIHHGIVKKIVEGVWFNVIDPAFHLHANMKSVTKTWMVTMYLDKQNPSYSIELFDACHNLVMWIGLHSDAKSDINKISLWRDALLSLPEKPNV